MTYGNYASLVQLLATQNSFNNGGLYDFNQGYIPGPPLLEQFKAPNEQTEIIEFYKLDGNGFPVSKFIGGLWVRYSLPGDYAILVNPGIYRRPLGMAPAMSEADKENLAFDMASSGLFKPKTEYIKIGDEVPGEGTIDFKSLMVLDDYNLLIQYLTFMPRQFLHEFFMQKIYPGIPYQGPISDTRAGSLVVDPIYGITYMYKSYQYMVWQGFIDMFNIANLDYINKNQINPWDWEQQKLSAYFQSQNADQMAVLQKQFDEYNEVTLALDPIAKKIMDDFASLPKLGDLGHEINRQSAVKQLLKMREYETAQAIVDAFRYAKDTVLGEPLTKPFPENFVLSDGTVIAEKSNPPVS